MLPTEATSCTQYFYAASATTTASLLTGIFLPEFFSTIIAETKHIGIANVNSRIKPIYGNEIQQHIMKPTEMKFFIMCHNEYDVLTAHKAMKYPGIGENSIYRLLKSGEEHGKYQSKNLINLLMLDTCLGVVATD